MIPVLRSHKMYDSLDKNEYSLESTSRAYPCYPARLPEKLTQNEGCVFYSWISTGVRRGRNLASVQDRRQSSPPRQTCQHPP